MKTTSGSFGVGTQQSNSVVDAMLKYPEISSTLIQQYPRYALTYLLERTGRHAGLKIAGDKSFEWKVLGRSNRKVSTIAQDAIAADASGPKEIQFAVDVDWVRKYDVVRMPGGAVGNVTAVTGVAGVINGGAAGGYGITVNFAAGNPAVAAAGDEVIAVIGSAFKEGSLGTDVGETSVYPETHKNWLTVNRRKLSITGHALTDVTWIENNGSKLWYFTAEKLFTDEFMYQLELQRWFGKTNVVAPALDAYTAPGQGPTQPANETTAGGAPLMGDGILAQIDSSNTQYYGADLEEDDLAKFIAKLSRNAQSPEGNEWVVFTGTEGRYQFHKAMKGLTVGATEATGGSMQSMKTGSDVSLGVNYTSYNVLGNKLTIAYCPVFDDTNAFGAAAGVGGGSVSQGGAGTMSGKMVFLDFSSVDGVPNIQLVCKGADGFNRNYIKKYIPGMINPYDQKSMLAANGDDSFTCQIMSESGVIVRNPLSCGVLMYGEA